MIPGRHAAGQVVGSLPCRACVGGAGLTAGSMLGRIAGTGAGRHARAG
jgi:tricarballylate dehydrogenase